MKGERKYAFGQHPVHKTLNTLVAIIATILAITYVMSGGNLLSDIMVIVLIIFIWFANSILGSDKNTAFIFFRRKK